MSEADLAAAFAAIDAFVAARMAADATPGLALALTDRERPLRVATYGFADLAAGTPVAPETLFEIGSIGKSFTADALLILSERGAVDLDAPVTRYLRWFAVHSRFAPITLRHLLTHTAAIIAGPDGSPSGEGEVWQLRESETAGPSGARFHYSNVGYKALGLVLAEVAGRPYPEAIQDLLLRPLGMGATESAITNRMRQRLAVGYAGLHDDRPFHPRQPLVPATWLETDTGDGCLACPPADLAAYARMLLNRGQGPAGPILREASFAEKVGSRLGPGDGSAYGLGIMLREDGGRMRLGHGGGMVGYLASLLVDPDAGFGVTAMTNGPGRPGAIARFALDALTAAASGEALPSVPSPGEVVPDEIVGGFRRVEGRGPDALRIAATGDPDGPLHLQFDEGVTPLLPEGPNALLADHPALARFRLALVRDEDGRVAAIAHGAARYVRAGIPAAAAAQLPAEWTAYPGHYRSHNPWCPSFDVVPRRGRLWLLFPAAPDGFDEEQPLAPLAQPGLFRAGDDEAGPERVAFDAVAGGRALGATLSGCPYWRVGE